MKKLLIAIAFLGCGFYTAEAQSKPEFKVITVVESIVPGGLGRSRLIDSKTQLDINEFTTERTDGKKSDQRSVKRNDAKVDLFEETKLLNFFNLGGIRFQNIAANDAVITSKINAMIEDGWELAFVTSAVESDAGKNDGQGIFITRFIFKRNK